ncbi:hypothetical protein Pth03_73990 [Planotetraspora thailandica]|uniref:BD-FAE-like domain-containing protein n=1 Tax=Planotetraspora thailandica TaxID=487172 RepID=A0A8J4DEZ0_9ACTN|nr:alpha/beta fold hydrolase [Planotetraspora thailandica]GII59010.1 hypothetical protein Pth03_73990 [Planotetraspora thailandica]
MNVKRNAETIRYEYGSEPDQFGEFHPARSGDPRGTVVFIHGGVWRAGRGWDTPDRAIDRLVLAGWNVWKIQFRGVGGGGGWPNTGDDVLAAVSFLPEIQRDRDLPLRPIILVGHSSGGHLAVWALSATHDQVAGAVSVEGVLDLRRAEAEELGDGGVVAFLGGTSAELPDRYRTADPVQNIRPDMPVRLIHARDDTAVPLSQSEAYLEAAQLAGQDASLALVDGDHFTPIDPDSTAWLAVEGAIEDLSLDR